MTLPTCALPEATARRRARGVSWRVRIALEGAREAIPMTLGFVPFALAIGATIGASSAVPALAGWSGAPLIFAGSAQLTTIDMLNRGVTPVVIIASALAVNARLVVFSGASATWFRSASRMKRALLAAPLVDPLYLACAARFARGDLDERGREAYFWGAAGTMAFAWMTAQALAIVAGASLPPSLGLHIAGPLVLAGLVAKAVTTPATARAAVVAGLVAVVAVALPLQTSIIAAMAVGVVAGSARKRGVA